MYRFGKAEKFALYFLNLQKKMFFFNLKIWCNKKLV